MKKYKLLLFDLDGTLMDYPKDQEFAVRYAFDKLGYECTDTVLEEFVKISSIVWTKLEKGEIESIAELYKERVGLLFQTCKIDESIVRFNHLLDEGLYKTGTLYEGVEGVLKSLSKRYKLGIITNAPEKQQQIRLKNANISQYFSYVFTSERIGYNKPDRKFFDCMFERLEEKDKSKMLVIGDSLLSDIQGGINAGLDTCWYNAGNKQNTGQIQPCYEIHRIEELLGLLAE